MSFSSPLLFSPLLFQLAMRREEYFSLATKRSQAYAHAVQHGLGTPKSDEHMQMVETWKEEGEKARARVSSALLDRLFTEGECCHSGGWWGIECLG
jgi:hypothetical protein